MEYIGIWHLEGVPQPFLGDNNQPWLLSGMILQIWRKIRHLSQLDGLDASATPVDMIKTLRHMIYSFEMTSLLMLTELAKNLRSYWSQ